MAVACLSMKYHEGVAQIYFYVPKDRVRGRDISGDEIGSFGITCWLD